MRAEEVMVILIVSVGAIIFYSLLLRYRKRELQHKERLAALEKGMPLPELHEARSEWTPRIYLLRGMMWLFGGVAIAVFLGGISGSTQHVPSIEDRLRRAQNLKHMGASDEQVQKEENDTTPEEGMPATMALLGLVPIGVGLAYLIYYRAESKDALPPKQASL